MARAATMEVPTWHRLPKRQGPVPTWFLQLGVMMEIAAAGAETGRSGVHQHRAAGRRGACLRDAQTQEAKGLEDVGFQDRQR